MLNSVQFVRLCNTEKWHRHQYALMATFIPDTNILYSKYIKCGYLIWLKHIFYSEIFYRNSTTYQYECSWNTVVVVVVVVKINLLKSAMWQNIWGCIQKFLDWVNNKISNNNNNNKQLFRSSTKGYGSKTHYTDSQNNDTTAPTGRELYHFQFSLQAASLETFGYIRIQWPSCFVPILQTIDCHVLRTLSLISGLVHWDTLVHNLGITEYLSILSYSLPYQRYTVQQIHQPR
jgi:hypothetical protein